MDVSHLKSIATIGKGRLANTSKKAVLQEKKTVDIRKSGVDKAQIKRVLDKVIKNVRLQYEIRDEPGYFVVRVIDKDTDKVIREIPSKELQRVHDQIEEILGIIFDQKV